VKRDELLAPLRQLPRLGTGIGLHRMLDLCRDSMGSAWFRGLDAIKVTGSNGKGSVCAMTAAILRGAGVEAGLYTSPHLFDFRERIALGVEPISEDDLAAGIARFDDERERYAREHPGDEIGAFEAFTAVALDYYARRRPASVVAEAGIGGRYDSTRVFPGRLTALVSLDLEHTALLGRTLEEIAYDKADLAAEGTTLVLGDLRPEIRRRLDAYGRLRRLEVVAAGDVCAVYRAEVAASGTRLDLEIDGRRWRDVGLALLGAHQVANARLAVVLATRWLARHRPGADLEAAVRRGLAGVRWPCRLEKVRGDPDVFVDAGHTPGAVDALAASLAALLRGRRILLVTGISRDKDIAGILTRLLPLAAAVVATRAHHRGAPAAEVAAVVRERAPELPLEVAEPIEDALSSALARAGREEMTVVVAGGLFLAAEAKWTLGGGDPRRLRFF